MPYIEEIITAGKLKEVSKYHTFKHQSKKRPRGKNLNTTPEQMAKVNERRAEKKLRILLNANFKENDLYLTLTYESDTPDPIVAKMNLTKFTRKLRDLYKKVGDILKYIAVTEYRKKRIHHHVIINKAIQVGKSAIKKLWGFGFSKMELFGGEPDDCQRLASYLIKETKKTFNTDEKVHGLRWIGSKNLIHPIPEKRVVSANSWQENPKAQKGYYLDVNSITRDRTIDGYPYLFYRLIKFDETDSTCHEIRGG